MKLQLPLLVSALSSPLASVVAQDDFACATVGSDADCVTCLTEGCVHTVGECLSSCDVIADAACWDMQYHPNKTVEEVCNLKEQKETDQNICGAEELQTDCGACTSTAKSTEGTFCEWYTIPGDDFSYCGSGGCDMMGVCGTSTCGTEATEPVFIDEGGMDAHMDACNNFDACEPCLNSRIECAWVADSCQPSCDTIMDAACYHPSNFPNMTGPEICQVATESTAEEVMDTTTTTTTVTTTTTATTTEEEGDLQEDSHPCNGFDYCEPCLNSRIECAWIGGGLGCQPTCDDTATTTATTAQAKDGTTCYHPGEEAFVGQAGPEICEAAVEAGDAKPVPTTEEGDGEDHGGHDHDHDDHGDGDGDSDEGGMAVSREVDSGSGSPQELESAAVASQMLWRNIVVAVSVGLVAVGLL